MKHEISLRYECTRAASILFLFTAIAGLLLGAEQEKLPLLYPFTRDGKWGYIDGTGAWVIQPRFGRCLDVFESDRVRVWEGDKVGYIDRKGQWIVEPGLYYGLSGRDEPFEVVRIDRKLGILARSGQLALPVNYDEIVLSGDRAWARDDEKLGLFALDGHWILKPSIHWPLGRQMPVPTDNGSVFWFRHGSKWGVLSREGMVLFKPRFKDHVLGRGESDYDWNHPDGLDFKHQRAWVMEGKDFLLISNEGKILTRQRFIDVQEWTDQLYVFTNLKGGVGLISKDGKIVIPAMYHAIRSPVEGRAVVGRMINKTMPNGATDTFWEYGYIDEHGKMIVAPGTFNGPGVENGGQTELAPFSENFAPVSNNDPESSKRQIYDPCAGYIDPSGALMIPKSFYLTRPFSEGLGAVQERKPRQNMSHEGGLWGYVDKTGGMVIAPQFAHVTPFCRSRAWALKAGARWEEAQWAMIDQTGKALTDFSYEPPERGTNWHSFGEKDNRFMKSRWLGKFAIIKHSDFHNGLATAEGKMIAEPIYNRIGEFHDGVAVAVDSRQHNGQGRVTFITSLITALGEVLAKGTYSEITDFKHGIAWATHQHDDDRNGQLERMGWGLIDTSAREICEPKYVIASWVRGPNHDYTKKSPTFYDELAPVTISSDYKAEGRVSHGWGYINQAGKVVVWDENIPGR